MDSIQKLHIDRYIRRFVMDGVSESIEKIRSLAKKIIETIKNLFSKAGDLIQGKSKAIVQRVFSIAKKIYNKLYRVDEEGYPLTKLAMVVADTKKLIQLSVDLFNEFADMVSDDFKEKSVFAAIRSSIKTALQLMFYETLALGYYCKRLMLSWPKKALYK